MAYTFALVDRNNGETFREQDLDQLVDNDFHLLDETDFKVLFAQVRSQYNTATAVPFAVTITGVSGGISGTGSQKVADHDVSALSDGLQTMSVGGQLVYWVKTPDINYVTMWSNTSQSASPSGGYDTTVNSVTVIAHREQQYW